MNTKEKHVYLFSELDQAEAYAKDGWDSVRGLLGGKGANLADMTRLGVPVPPGLTVTTESCNAFLEAGEEFPEGMWDQVLEGLKAVEAQMGAAERSTGAPWPRESHQCSAGCPRGSKLQWLRLPPGNAPCLPHSEWSRW